MTDGTMRRELAEIGEGLTDVASARAAMEMTRVGDLLFRLAHVYGRLVNATNNRLRTRDMKQEKPVRGRTAYDIEVAAARSARGTASKSTTPRGRK